MTTTRIDLPAPYRCRPLTTDDAGAVTDLMAVCEEHDIGEVQIELEDIVGDWQRPSFDLATQSLGVYDDQDRLVAYAEVYQARRAEVHVLPEQRGHGLGSALMGWTWRLAADLGGTLVGQTVPQAAAEATALFEAHGYRRLWTSWILELPEGADIAAGRPPDGVRIRPVVLGRDEQQAYRTVEDAFGEWPDRDPVSFDDWAAVVLRRPGFEAWQLMVAVERQAGRERAGRDQADEEQADEEQADEEQADEEQADEEQVVGVCFVTPSRDTGWVQYLAVRRDRRGRGLARALLLRAFGEARARGMTRAELSTDTRTGALDLYLHAGMRVKQTFVHWARDLQPAGQDAPARA